MDFFNILLDGLDSPVAVPDATLGPCSRQDSTSPIHGLVPPASMQSCFRRDDLTNEVRSQGAANIVDHINRNRCGSCLTASYASLHNGSRISSEGAVISASDGFRYSTVHSGGISSRCVSNSIFSRIRRQSRSTTLATHPASGRPLARIASYVSNA